MRQILRLFVVGAVLGTTLVGCGGGEEVVTDVTKVKPLTVEEQKAVRAADDAIAKEENANPTQPTRGGAAKK